MWRHFTWASSVRVQGAFFACCVSIESSDPTRRRFDSTFGISKWNRIGNRRKMGGEIMAIGGARLAMRPLIGVRNSGPENPAGNRRGAHAKFLAQVL